MIRMLVALGPCLLVAVYNSGYQANLALAKLGMTDLPGWRGAFLDALRIGYEPSNVSACIAHGVLYVLPILLVALITAGLWESLFAIMRKRRLTEGFVVTAVLFTLILPPGAPLWQVALGISFGIVIGKEIFGGTGKNFLNPTLTSLVFLHFAYPNAMAGDPLWSGVAGYSGTTIFSMVAAGGVDVIGQAGIGWWQSFLGGVQGALGVTSTLACLLGAVVLLYTRVASWRVMAGVLIGLVATASLCNWAGASVAPILALPWYWHLTLGSFAFGMVFLATDPVTGAATDTGRWVYGLLIGFMIVLVRVANPVHPDGVMLAILLGNIFAPLIDYGVIWANMRRRALRRA
jgi:Na+-transporting NADH:ubiquinone oxidoreductase subunit B